MAIPGQPVMDDATADDVRELMAKGFAGTVFFGTDDCWRDYHELVARGVEFIGEPTEQPYGIDVGFRDPSGNNFRLVQEFRDPCLTSGLAYRPGAPHTANHRVISASTGSSPASRSRTRSSSTLSRC